MTNQPIRRPTRDNPTEIMYRYALDDNSRVIEIDSSSTVKGKDYICLSCKGPLRLVKGEKRQKHFRHRVLVNCSTETYLHNLAKHVFQQTYIDCQNNKKPFLVEYTIPVNCSKCKNHVGHELKQVDLTRHFTKISLETRNRKFTPDILLTTETGNEVLYVEIAVTHYVEENKIKSGVRIIEFSVAGETDIDLISSCCLSEEDPRVSIINFKKQPLLRANQHTCPSAKPAGGTAEISKPHEGTVPCFFLYKSSGKCLQKNCTKSEFDKLSAKSAYSKMLDTPGAEFVDDKNFLLRFFVDNIQQAYLAGSKIKNCWLCNFHSRKQSLFSLSIIHTGQYSYCNKHKKFIENSNEAANCKEFWSINNLKPGDDLLTYNQLRAAKYREQNQTLQVRKVQNNDLNQVRPFTIEAVTEKETRSIPKKQIKSGRRAKCVYCGVELEFESEEWWAFHAASGECKCKHCLKKGIA